ncbi:MAG: hypothetical protein P1P86_13940 [Bacteroidales bacterium]|nr:hypothetical protein [Bacteroidales bacterium]
MKKSIISLLLIVLITACKSSYQGELLFIEPGEGDSFRYPYFLFIPDQVPAGQKSFVIVEPNNSGFADDDLQKHIEKAERIASLDFYPGNYVAQNLKYPLLVPVFPRQKSQWKIYTHALDRDVIIQKDKPLERLDEQLLGMFKNARHKLKAIHIETEERFLMTGFSASGTFANRFTLLHPDKVFAVAGGGLNGLLMLPVDTLLGKEISYPLGTHDFFDLTGKEFQKELFLQTPQFYYMGELDDNDAVPYDDAFDQDERELIYELLGREMLPHRWNRCELIYMHEGVNARIRTYENTGHEIPENVKQEIVEFFQRNIQEGINMHQ